MTSEIICIFKRNSKCIFKGGPCDQDCDSGEWQENIRSNENLVAECLGKVDRKVVLSRKVSNLFFP
jgi:hypothetical protein